MRKVIRSAICALGAGAAVTIGILATNGVLEETFRRLTGKGWHEEDDGDAGPVKQLKGKKAKRRERARKSAAVGADASVLVEVLKGNQRLFSKQDQALLTALIEQGQAHLFEKWPAPGRADNHKRRCMRQLSQLDSSYPGGLIAYIKNAKRLLADAREGKNPFEGFTPSVPPGEKLDFCSPDFQEAEDRGAQEAGNAAFVLVAGGLGERLGYSGIKVALPVETATNTSFLQLYCSYIKALQDRFAPAGRRLPFVIMTSDDTHSRTVALLQQHKYFGLDKRQVHLLKQEKVACLIDNDARLALDPADEYCVQTKPHGHGDVHSLLHTSGLAKHWLAQGMTWLCFFQDTNALVTKALAAALGVSAKNNFDMNSLAVPRKAKEAIGALAALRKANGSAMTINVEYNQLDPLLRSTISKEGDVNDASGYSPFPGNINQLVIKLESYVPQLAATRGIISEFVNPKYKDSSKTAFKSSTRLECMMQDYPKALPPSAKIGFTVINQVWASYSPVKNSVVDAQAKEREGNPTHSATAAEMDQYKATALQLQQLCGAQIGQPQKAFYNGIGVEVYPRVVLSPSFATTLSECKSKIKEGSIRLAPGAVLVIEGPGVRIEGPVDVDGALVIKASRNAKVTIRALTVRNAGWEVKPLAEGEDAPEELRIRGFKVQRNETRELLFTKPGSHTFHEPAGAQEDAGSSTAEAVVPSTSVPPSTVSAVKREGISYATAAGAATPAEPSMLAAPTEAVAPTSPPTDLDPTVTKVVDSIFSSLATA